MALKTAFIATLTLALLAGAAHADDGVITRGKLYFPEASYDYEVHYSPGGFPGCYIKIDLPDSNYLIVTPDLTRGDIAPMAYTRYRPNGYDAVLRERRVTPVSCGDLAMDLRSVPRGRIGIMNGRMSGEIWRTHRAHVGASVKWIPDRTQPLDVTFVPMVVNQDPLERWMAWTRAALARIERGDGDHEGGDGEEEEGDASTWRAKVGRTQHDVAYLHLKPSKDRGSLRIEVERRANGTTRVRFNECGWVTLNSFLVAGETVSFRSSKGTPGTRSHRYYDVSMWFEADGTVWGNFDAHWPKAQFKRHRRYAGVFGAAMDTLMEWTGRR